jgi:hypothetical protein
MKKLLFILVCILSIHSISFAQVEKQIPGQAMTADDKKKLEDTFQGWKFGGGLLATISQAAFVNWAPGGINSIGINFKGNFYADYKKNKHLFTSRFTGEYGINFLRDQYPTDKKYRPTKSADSWELFAKYGYKVHKPLYVAAYGSLRSQFSNTYTANSLGIKDSVISRAGSPLVFEGAIGLDYVPNDKFSLFFSPLATKITYVGDAYLASRNAYGVGPGHTKSEFGAVLIATYKQSFWKDKVTISSIFRAYKNYLRGQVDPNLAAANITARETKYNYRKNIDVDWQTTIGFNVNKYLSASVFTHLIWDNDVLTPVKGDVNNTKQQVQFRDIIGINVGYNLNYSKVKGEKPKAF